MTHYPSYTINTDIKVGDKFTHRDYGAREFVAHCITPWEITTEDGRQLSLVLCTRVEPSMSADITCKNCGWHNLVSCKRVEPKVNKSPKIRPGDNFTWLYGKGRTFTCKRDAGSAIIDETEAVFPIDECTRIGKVDKTPVKVRKLNLRNWMREQSYYNVEKRMEPVSSGGHIERYKIIIGFLNSTASSGYDYVCETANYEVEAIRKCRKVARARGYKV